MAWHPITPRDPSWPSAKELEEERVSGRRTYEAEARTTAPRTATANALKQCIASFEQPRENEPRSTSSRRRGRDHAIYRSHSAPCRAAFDAPASRTIRSIDADWHIDMKVPVTNPESRSRRLRGQPCLTRAGNPTRARNRIAKSSPCRYGRPSSRNWGNFPEWRDARSSG